LNDIILYFSVKQMILIPSAIPAKYLQKRFHCILDLYHHFYWGIDENR